MSFVTTAGKALAGIMLALATGLAADNPAAIALKELGVTAITPPTINTRPSPRYWPRIRMWQGIPSIERTPGGRLWSTWYTGPMSEGFEGNYAVLVTSGDDGKTWSMPVAVYDPSMFGGGNTGDPSLWVDPRGRLWWFLSRSLNVGDSRGHRTVWAFCAEDPDVPEPKWGKPVFAGFGVTLNKPVVLKNGDWLRPVDLFVRDPLRTQFYVSHDEGKSYQFLSKTPIKDVTFSEHMTVERSDGSLLTMVRTTYGIAQIESFDRGATWVNDRPFTTERNVNTRFYLARLKSGALLLVLNDHARQRTNMTAMLSEDDGKTWPHTLLLDERPMVSYPDGTEGSNGFIYITYDRGRYHRDQQEILFAKITEADIKAGKMTNLESRLKQLINRLADFGGGVRFDREPQELQKRFEQRTESAAEIEKAAQGVPPKP
jgi:hypothetical protein